MIFWGGRTYFYFIDGVKYRLSPTTIRYIKVWLELTAMFDFKKIKSIAEIGAGYGGECRIIKSDYRKVKYVIFDLPEVLMLAKRFLSYYPECNDVEYVDGTNMDMYQCQQPFDLVISNYAFCELSRNVQDVYLEKVIKKSKHGYITWSVLSYKELGAYSLEELLQKIPNAKIIEEKPLTYKGNAIIVW